MKTRPHPTSGAQRTVFRAGGIAACAFAALAALPASAQLTWTGGSGDFNTASNWSPAQTPTASDPVTFNANETETISFSGAADSDSINLQQGNYTFDLGTQTWTGGRLRFGDGNNAAWTSDTVFSGGTLNSGFIQAGVFGNDDDSSLTLTNGHTLNSDGNTFATVGREGSNTTLNVESGSTLNVIGLQLATLAGSNGNAVTVDGAGSAINLNNTTGFSTRGALRVGPNGENNNILTVSNGGAIDHKQVETGDIVIVGQASNNAVGSGNKLIVTGAGSTFTSDSEFLYVRGGTGAGNAVEITNDGTLNLNSTGATFFVQGSNTLLVDGGTLNVTAGTLDIDTATAVLDFRSGEINVQTAASSSNTKTSIGDGIGPAEDAVYNAVTGGISHNFFAGGGLLVETDGAVVGEGTFIGDVEVDGRIAPGSDAVFGTLTLQEDLILNASAVTRIKVDGFSAGEFDLIDQLNPSTVDLGGTLLLEFASGFNTIGSATILGFDTITGNFDDVQSSGLASGFTASFDSLTGDVSVIPEPGTYGFIGGGIALFLALLRRR